MKKRLLIVLSVLMLVLALVFIVVVAFSVRIERIQLNEDGTWERACIEDGLKTGMKSIGCYYSYGMS